MIHCNDTYYRMIEDKYHDTLIALPPNMRAAEKFRLALENMPAEISASDIFIGWFGPSEKIDTTNFRRVPKPVMPTEEEQKKLDFPASVGSRVVVDKGHTCVNYEMLLKRGLSDYYREIEEEKKNNPDNDYLTAMGIMLEAVRDFANRLAVLAEEKNGTSEEKAHFKALAERIRRVPWYPSKDITDALQAIWIIHFLTPLAEHAWYSISLGRFDRYMLPYYEQSLSEGMSRDEIKEQFHYFRRLLNNYADAACLMNVGPDYNELSNLLIECQKELALPSPILAARIAKDTPEEDLLNLIDTRLFSRGQPTFYSEEGCVCALTDRGVEREEALGFSNSSCMGISIQGKEFDSMWGCVFEVNGALEMAVTGGRLLKDHTGDTAEYASFSELYNAFDKYCRIILDGCLEAYDLTAYFSALNDPDPFITAITDDCIKVGKDRIYSAKYHNVTVECMGMINAADGLYAIEKLVYDEKKYTLDEFANGVKNNFADNSQLRQDILTLSRFGMGGEADEMSYKVANMIADHISAHNNGNRFYIPSMHTLDTNVQYGSQWGAGFDGRESGAPFAKNAGPANESRKKDPTAVILSCAALPQYRFSGGQPLDLSFDPALIEKKKEVIAALVRIYLESGGLQLQVNGVSVDVLKDAVAHPEDHEDLVVRIGGYSHYFNLFSERSKLEFIQRFEKECGIR